MTLVALQSKFCSKKSALVAHVQRTGHEFDFEDAQILKKVRAKGLLKIHEANQIILHEGTAVNFKKDARHISPVGAKFKPKNIDTGQLNRLRTSIELTMNESELHVTDDRNRNQRVFTKKEEVSSLVYYFVISNVA